MSDMDKFVRELNYHSSLIDIYLDAGIEGLIDSENSMKMVEYHSAMMIKLMAKIISYLDDQGVLEGIKSEGIGLVETRGLLFFRKLNILYNGRTAILRRYVMDICKKIWKSTVTVGQIITSAIIALTIGVVLWLLVQMFRPNKN